ncbi:MAG: thioredoxin domain-containing protein [Cyanobacteria bacterium J06641_5]
MSLQTTRSTVFTFIAVAILCCGLLGCSGEASGDRTSSLTGLASLRGLSREAMPYAEATRNHQPTLVEFYADWCTTCQGMAPMLADLHQKQSELNFVALDIDEPRWADLVARYEVSGVPKIVLLDREATPIQTFVGAVPQIVLERAIAALD